MASITDATLDASGSARQHRSSTAQLVALALRLVRRQHDGEGATAEGTDASLSKWRYSIT